MTQLRLPSLAAALAAPWLLLALASSPRAQPPAVAPTAVAHDVPGLKAAYLHCERAAAERLLGSAEAGHCSVIYETLLERGFGGDFRRLLAWWQAERLAQARGERVAAP